MQLAGTRSTLHSTHGARTKTRAVKLAPKESVSTQPPQ